jgi:hypothetical protein
VGGACVRAVGQASRSSVGETLHRLLNGEGSANHHDDESKHHDGPGDESVSRVPVTPPTSRETEVRGSREDECHWSGHQTPIEPQDNAEVVGRKPHPQTERDEDEGEDNVTRKRGMPRGEEKLVQRSFNPRLTNPRYRPIR